MGTGQTPNFNVIFLAASVYEFNMDRARKEAGYPYLTYVAGEVSTQVNQHVLWSCANTSRRFSMSLVKRASSGLRRTKTTPTTWLAGYWVRGGWIELAACIYGCHLAVGTGLPSGNMSPFSSYSPSIRSVSNTAPPLSRSTTLTNNNDNGTGGVAIIKEGSARCKEGLTWKRQYFQDRINIVRQSKRPF